MMRNTLVFGLAMLLLIANHADAKRGGFGGRSSFSSSRSSGSLWRSSSSSSRSSGIIWRSSSSSGSKAASRPEPIKVDRKAYLSGLSKKGATGKDAGALYKSFREREKPVFSNADIFSRFTPKYRQERRAAYYQDYTPMHGSHYASAMGGYQGSGFGVWDYMLFDSMLDNLGDRLMYYHHQDDPGFREWRGVANKACAEGDADICLKLASLDKDIAAYTAQNIKPDPAYVTPGIDPDIYEASQIDLSKLPAIKVCTGSAGADYDRYLAAIGRLTKIKTIRVASNGSADNFHKMASGECDLAFAQTDVVTGEHVRRLATLNKMEVGFLICPKADQIKGVPDLSDKLTVYIGADQTGAQATFSRLAVHVPGIDKLKVNSSLNILAAAKHVIAHPEHNCLWAVSRPLFAAFTALDESGKFAGVPIYSWDFKDKKTDGFDLVTIDAGYYNNLTLEENITYGWFTTGGTDSIGVKTGLYATDSWVAQNMELYDLLNLEKSKLAEALK